MTDPTNEELAERLDRWTIVTDDAMNGALAKGETGKAGTYQEWREDLRLAAARLRQPLPSGDGWTPTHRHRKTGGLYRLIGPATIEATMGRAAIYEARDGTTWVRPWGEFHDGRFDALPQEGE